MGSGGTARASRSVFRSVPGALRERPGVLQQRQNNPTRYGEMDASKKYGLFVKFIFKKRKQFRKRHTCKRSWPYGAYLSASLANMGLEGAAGASWSASRSVPGALRERPGALRQCQNNPTRYGEMDASKKYDLFVKSIFKKRK